MKTLFKMTSWLGIALSAPAMAEAPMQVQEQVPGYFRQAVGEFEVTALFDGYNDLSPELLQGLAPEKVRALLARQAIGPERIPTAFNAFLINTKHHLVLVDSGAGHCVPQTAGQLIPNIRASGYTPAQVTTIFLTHMHLDHVCGLVDASGKALFPNATVYVTQAEADFWLDPRTEASAPENAKEYFAIAQHSLAPYKDSGRLKTFVPPASPIPEVQTSYAIGHTPGSAVYRFASKGSAISFIGDLIHNAAVQFAHPEVVIRFDVDPNKARQARNEAFTKLAADGEWVAAAHLPFPGIGHITPRDKHFSWVPAPYGPYQRAANVPLLK